MDLADTIYPPLARVNQTKTCSWHSSYASCRDKTSTNETMNGNTLLSIYFLVRWIRNGDLGGWLCRHVLRNSMRLSRSPRRHMKLTW